LLIKTYQRIKKIIQIVFCQKIDRITGILSQDVSSHKKVALCYLVKPFLEENLIGLANHENIKIIVRALQVKGFNVDIYNHNATIDNDKNNYDLIIGFGRVYDSLCKNNPKAPNILFLVEMPKPYMIEAEKAASERLKSKGIRVSNNMFRSGKYYTLDNTNTPADVISMGSFENISVMKRYSHSSSSFWRIDCSVNTSLLSVSRIKKIKRNYAWVGSGGAMLKGLDILIEIFNSLPHLTLNIYGVSNQDSSILKLARSGNVINHGYVNFRTKEFQQGVGSQMAVISASASEGMQTSIITSLCLGTRCIATPSCGIPEDIPGVTIVSESGLYDAIFLYDESSSDMSQDEINSIRTRFSLTSFSVNIKSILDNIL
jgi:glycosyltransferase involved in cell wall biosynthesis